MASDFMEQLFAAWNAHDAEIAVPLFTEDCIYEDVPTGSRWLGHDGVREMVSLMDTHLGDYAFPVATTQTDGNLYAIEWEMKGTNPNGVPYAVRGASVGTLRDGKIAHNRDYWDRASMPS